MRHRIRAGALGMPVADIHGLGMSPLPEIIGTEHARGPYIVPERCSPGLRRSLATECVSRLPEYEWVWKSAVDYDRWIKKWHYTRGKRYGGWSKKLWLFRVSGGGSDGLNREGLMVPSQRASAQGRCQRRGRPELVRGDSGGE